jgi:hypothetical protein
MEVEILIIFHVLNRILYVYILEYLRPDRSCVGCKIIRNAVSDFISSSHSSTIVYLFHLRLQ